ncbi:MAG: hypothetical protein RL662_236 [Bacteroidota bacterium]|jgi:hypothetical protein
MKTEEMIKDVDYIVIDLKTGKNYDIIMKIKELGKRNWDYVLYEVDDKLILTVIFFSQIDYPRSFVFGRDEVSLHSEDLEKLAQGIRDNYLIYKDKEVNPPVLT